MNVGISDMSSGLAARSTPLHAPKFGATEEGLLPRASRRRVVQANGWANKVRLVKLLSGVGRHFLLGEQVAWPLLKTFQHTAFPD
jgi:hypothetical protein